MSRNVLCALTNSKYQTMKYLIRRNSGADSVLKLLICGLKIIQNYGICGKYRPLMHACFASAWFQEKINIFKTNPKLNIDNDGKRNLIFMIFRTLLCSLSYIISSLVNEDLFVCRGGKISSIKEDTFLYKRRGPGNDTNRINKRSFIQ